LFSQQAVTQFVLCSRSEINRIRQEAKLLYSSIDTISITTVRSGYYNLMIMVQKSITYKILKTSSEIVHKNLKFKDIIPCNLTAIKIAIFFPINCNAINFRNQNTHYVT